MTDIRLVYISSPFESRISSIFEKKNGYFSNDALLCQDILRYYYEINKDSEENPFRLSDLANWIVRNNNEIREYYKDLSTWNTTYSNRVHARKQRISGKLEGLTECRLIRIIGTTKGEKTKVDIPLYSYTQAGKLLALIIKSMNLQNGILYEVNLQKIQNKQSELKQNNEIIYKLLDSTLPIGEDYPYSSIFYKSFYKKTKDKGIFDKVVMYMVDILSSNVNIKDVDDLLKSIYDFGFKDIADRKKFSELMYDTEEQNPEAKAIILYKNKLSVEGRFEHRKRHLSRKYEREQFRFRDDYEKIVLEGNCEKCKQPTIVVWSYREYRERFADMDANGFVRFDCQNCKSENSCVIPNF